MACSPTRRALLAMPAILSAQTSSTAINVAFIGVGNRGGYLLTHMLKVPGVKVVAIADIAPETLAAAGKVATEGGHSPALYADFRKMLEEHKEIDAVVIATPVNTHKDIAIAALEVGKHVYCEKPMAITPEECRLVVNASKTAKGIFQMGFQLRHDPNRRASMDFIHAGGIGKLLYAQGFRHTGDLPRNTAWYFDRTISGDNIVE
ncbi:MAG: Gfo/Idh/MocA family oxidoreductase [Bryobacteraceae bacterium]